MNTNRRLLREIQNSQGLFSITVFVGVVSGGLVVFQAWQLTEVINQVFLEQKRLQEVIPILGIFLLIVLCRVLLVVANEFLAGKLAASVKKHLRNLLFAKINRLGPAFTTRESTGELTASALQGVESLDSYFSQYLPQILVAAILPLIILLAVFPMDTFTGVVFLVTAPLIPFFMNLIGKDSETETKKQWSALSQLSSMLLDTLQGIVTLKNLGQSKKRIDQVKQISEEYRETTLRVLRITFLSSLTLELLATISTAVVAVEIGLRLLYNQLSFEQAFFILLLAPEFYLPMRNLGVRFHAGMSGVAAAKRIYELLDLPEPISSVQTSHRAPFQGREQIEIHFDRVSYRYPDRERDAVSNITLDLEPGKSIALVGRSGAGKSTLLQLLLRFIDPLSGKILVNGEDLSTLEVHEWRKLISLVPQNPTLFNTTILENIRLAKPGCSLAEVKKAAMDAQLDEFIDGLPRAYDTLVGEKAFQLSSGQAQRIALARAFLKDAPLLLMDEPTAHLDIVLENELIESIQKLMEGKTTIFIAHRYSTIHHADRVAILENGQLQGFGALESLENSNPFFRNILSAARGEG